MELGERSNFDFTKLDVSIMTSETMTADQADIMRRAMGETLSHLDLIRTLSDPAVKCHVDSYFRPVSQKEAAIRVARSGMEYCMIPVPQNDKCFLGVRVARALALAGLMMDFLEGELRSRGVNCAIEARTDMNRFNTLAALYPDGRIGLFFDVSPIYPRARNDNELARQLMSMVSDLSVTSMLMSLLHLARHAIQLDMFHKGNLDGPFVGMKERFLEGCADPAYYMASYPENLMCLEAEFMAMLDMGDLMPVLWPKANPEDYILDVLNYKAMWYNTENLLLPAASGVLPSYEFALAGLCSKMFKTAEWYRTEPRHDREISEDQQKEAGWDVAGGRRD